MALRVTRVARLVGGVFPSLSVCVVVVVFVDIVVTCSVYLALLSTINVSKTDVLNNYGDSMIGCPRTMI